MMRLLVQNSECSVEPQIDNEFIVMLPPEPTGKHAPCNMLELSSQLFFLR